MTMNVWKGEKFESLGENQYNVVEINKLIRKDLIERFGTNDFKFSVRKCGRHNIIDINVLKMPRKYIDTNNYYGLTTDFHNELILIANKYLYSEQNPFAKHYKANFCAAAKFAGKAEDLI